MRNALKRTGKSVAVAALAAFGIGCGSIDLPQTLALEGEDSVITIDIIVFGQPTGLVAETQLVGGIDMTISVGILDIFNPGGIIGVVTVDDVLFGGTEFQLLGQSTGTICAVDVPGGGGTVLIKIFQGTAAFDVAVDVLMHPLGPLGDAIPEGFPFPVELMSTAPFTFGDLLGILFGGGGGGLTVTQEFETVITGPGTGESILDLIDGSIVSGTLTLSSVDAIPPDPLLDECVAGLGL
jgi:hypothetical protein